MALFGILARQGTGREAPPGFLLVSWCQASTRQRLVVQIRTDSPRPNSIVGLSTNTSDPWPSESMSAPSVPWSSAKPNRSPSSTTRFVTPTAVSVYIWTLPRCRPGNPMLRRDDVRSRGGSSPRMPPNKKCVKGMACDAEDGAGAWDVCMPASRTDKGRGAFGSSRQIRSILQPRSFARVVTDLACSSNLAGFVSGSSG